MTRITSLAIAVALSVFVIPIVSIAQQDQSASSANSIYVELAKAPKKAAARRNPLESDAEAPAAGAQLFARHCAECHGETAEGGKKGPSLRAPEVQQSPPGAIFWLLTNGSLKNGMPPWSRLPEAQRWQLITYLKSLP